MAHSHLVAGGPFFSGVQQVVRSGSDPAGHTGVAGFAQNDEGAAARIQMMSGGRDGPPAGIPDKI